MLKSSNFAAAYDLSVQEQIMSSSGNDMCHEDASICHDSNYYDNHNIDNNMFPALRYSL